MTKEKNIPSKEQIDEILATLKARFEKNMIRHKGLDWENVKARIESDTDKITSLIEMEKTGGEPDVIFNEKRPDEILFVDCSAESPVGRRSFCYDNEALESRKENKPKNSAIGLATEIGIEILTEEQYRELQTLGIFDIKTSSWIKTPDRVRKLGGSFFCDRRYDTVFVYHNGADSYYSSRGFRGSLKI
jgi:hypothetical protein